MQDARHTMLKGFEQVLSEDELATLDTLVATHPWRVLCEHAMDRLLNG